MNKKKLSGNCLFHSKNDISKEKKQSLLFLLCRKIEIPLPNDQARLEVLKIHAGPITKHGDIDYEAIVKLSDGFNGADLRNVCTEAGLFAIRAERDYVLDEDFMKAVRKIADNKKLETKLDYKPV